MEAETLYARIFIVVVVVLFLWFLYRRRSSKHKRKYRYRGIDEDAIPDTYAQNPLQRHLDEYAHQVVDKAVASGMTTVKSQLDTVVNSIGLPTLPDGLTNGIASGMVVSSATAKAKPAGTYTNNKAEEECRAIFQKTFRASFPPVRPDFLKSPKTGRNLEIDIYNDDLKIACEYNGPQHYKYFPMWHKTKNDFYSQVKRDDWKRRKMKEHGIRLIEVPYWIKSNRLEEYIKGELRKKGIV